MARLTPYLFMEPGHLREDSANFSGRVPLKGKGCSLRGESQNWVKPPHIPL